MNKFTREEVIASALVYFKGDSLAANVWADKYALKDSEGNIYEKTPLDMHKRMAREVARIEDKYKNPLSYEEILEVFVGFKYLVPQGSPMAGIGNPFVKTSLSNCYVIPPTHDSYGGIMMTDQQQVQLMKRRGGVGHDLGTIRPIGSIANGSRLKGNTGMPLFMERFSNSTREVAQDNRRGALMLSCPIRHPDAEVFIDKKMDTKQVTGANVSVKVDDEFMESLTKDGKYTQRFPVDGNNPKITKEIDSRTLWNKIIYNAWKSAEPGVLFWDTILRESPTQGYGKSWKESSTNPCGEIPLNPYDSCRLLAINLYSYVDNPFTEFAVFNTEKFSNHVRKAQRIMDDIIDLEVERLDAIIDKIKRDPEPYGVKEVELDLWINIRKKAIEGRRTGLGITAEGDMIAALGYTYGTPDATEVAVSVHKLMAVEAYKSSIDMAEERGPFNIYYLARETGGFIDRIFEAMPYEYKQKWRDHGRRNIAMLTIAPTGTTSLMTQTSSGIEPVFMPAYKRRRKTENADLCVFKDEIGDMWEEYHVFHPKFKEWYNINNMDTTGLDVKELENCTDAEITELIKLSPYYNATSDDVDYIEKVYMQGAIQKWVDHSISVTVNVPKDTTVDTVAEIYMTAWKQGCKGVTIYRDGSRAGVLVKHTDDHNTEIIYIDAPKRPETLEVDMYNFRALGQDWTGIVGLLKGKPYEIFAMPQFGSKEFSKSITKGTLTRKGKQRYKLSGVYKSQEYIIDNIIQFMSADEQYQTRDLSGSLRHGRHPKHIVSDIDKSSYVSSFRRAISRILKSYLTNEDVSDKCPSCSEALVFESGCKTCNHCGWSACS